MTTIAAMTARLATRLSLKDEEEPVDLGSFKVPGKQFLAWNFYLVGRLNSSRAVLFDSFRRVSGTLDMAARGDRFLFTFSQERDLHRVKVKRGGPWGFQRPMIVFNDYDGFGDVTVKLDFVWIWVEISGIPLAFLTEPTISLIGRIIREVLLVDKVV
ncbi:hypothetical protein ACLB2K_016359 [Fragaria x ananassa]